MHKTNKIRNNSNPKDWYYIPTNLNIVDEFSRGVKFNDLYQHTIETDLDPVTGNSSDQIIDPSINVNRHHPSKQTGLSKRKWSNTQVFAINEHHLVVVVGL